MPNSIIWQFFAPRRLKHGVLFRCPQLVMHMNLSSPLQFLHFWEHWSIEALLGVVQHIKNSQNIINIYEVRTKIALFCGKYIIYLLTACGDSTSSQQKRARPLSFFVCVIFWSDWDDQKKMGGVSAIILYILYYCRRSECSTQYSIYADMLYTVYYEIYAHRHTTMYYTTSCVKIRFCRCNHR